MPPDQAHEVRGWLVKATQDWSAVKMLMAASTPLPAIAAFHCQQAVEKTLKAFLVYQQTPFEKVHDLRTIVRCCCESDSTFEQLLEVVEPLNIYAVVVRYPGPSDPTIEQVRRAMHAVEHTWKFVAKRLPASCLP